MDRNPTEEIIAHSGRENSDSTEKINDTANEPSTDEPPKKKQKFANGQGAPRDKQHSKNQSRWHGRKPFDKAGQRVVGPKGDALSDLKRGLQYVTNSAASQSFAEDVLKHARELHRLLFESVSNAGVASKSDEVAPPSPPPFSSQHEPQEEMNNPHTNLPPPFPLPDPRTFMADTAASTSLNQIAPITTTFAPVPGIANYSFTNLVPAPESAALPNLPPVTDVTLFNAPFTHTSALASYIPPTNTNTYEPLEFLGDAYLEVIATRLIHSRFPLHTVGQKAGLREVLIKNETLAEYSKAYNFGERVQSTETVRGQSNVWTKVLADVFEAYVACVIIQDPTENGFLTAEKWLTALWAPKILEWRAQGDGARDTSFAHQQLDAKSDLNRLLVGKESKLEYKEEREMELVKEGNRTIFYIGVYLTGWGFVNQHLGSGEGRSKQLAGTMAATNALKHSQDIIQLAHQRKMQYERQFKKKAALEKVKKGHLR